jgi:hypothetical protein
MKKLSIFMLISVLLTFWAAMALAHDDGNNWDRFHGNRFHGTYEMISSGICSHSTLGWTDKNGDVNGPVPPFTPVKDSVIWAANATIQATWLFNRNGTGTVSGTNYTSIYPGGDVVPTIGQSPIGFGFKYEITNNGAITVTITTPPSIGFVMNGMITPDKNTMTLLSANQILDLTMTPYKSYAIQNTLRVLIRVGD